MAKRDHVCGFALAKMDKVHFLADAKLAMMIRIRPSIGGWLATISALRFEIVRLVGRSIMKNHGRF